MPKLNLQPLLLVLLLILMTACYDSLWAPAGIETTITDGYKPVYGSSDATEIALLPPREVKDPGKIYRYGKFLLVNEKNSGIHIFDNEIPQEPKPLSFLSIFGNTDMAIRDNLLYADHSGNLVAIRFDEFSKAEVKGSLVIANWNQGLPPPSHSYFECVDPAKGVVVQWKRVQRQTLECYAF